MTCTELLDSLHIEDVMEALGLADSEWVEGMWLCKCIACKSTEKRNLVVQPQGRFVCLHSGRNGDAIDLFAHSHSIGRQDAVRALS